MSPLDKIALALRGISPKALGQKIVANAIEPLTELLEENLKEGKAPDGAPWVEKKKGGRAFVNAASKLSVTSSGDLIIASITGPEAFAQKGTKSHPIRQMLPDAGAEIPANVAEIIEKVVHETVENLLK